MSVSQQSFRRTKSQRKRSNMESKNTKYYFNKTTKPADSEYCNIKDDEDVFGTNSYVETFNNWSQNVYFQINREVHVTDSDDDNSISSSIESEDDWYTKDESPKFEIVGSLRITETTLRSINNLPRKQYLVIKELIDTGETFLKNMKHIIDNYLQYFRKLKISQDIERVFGNIEEIYAKSKELYDEIKECVSVEAIANIFLNTEYLFQCYAKYMRNKLISHLYATGTFGELIKERQIELSDDFPCESYLLNPVQRPGRYKLLLENLEKAVKMNNEECQALQEAIRFVDQKIKEANTMMVIDSIQNCPIDLCTKGNYLFKNTFNTKGKNTKEVVLFERCVVFCKAEENNSDLFNYDEHIEMDKLSLRYSPKSLKLYLASFGKIKNQTDKSKYEIELDASAMDIKEKWINEIHRILWDQLQYYKDQQIKENITRQLPKSAHHNNQSNLPDDLHYYNMKEDIYNKNGKIRASYFDKDKNLRIELLPSDAQRSQKIDIPNIRDSQDILINTLINTEEAYLEEIKANIDKYEFYCASMDLPWYMLKNINDIYSSTQKLFSKLLECNSIDSFAKVFLDNIDVFDSYKRYIWDRETYCRYSNAKFENTNYTSNSQADIKDGDLNHIDLLNPLVRLKNYKESLELLENDLSKIGESNETLNHAIILLNEKMREVYTLIEINSIRCCPINLKQMGLFIMKETFKTKYKYNEVIFLFEKVIIFCTEDRNRPDTYVYEDSIQTKMLSVIYTTNSTSFKLRNANKLDDDLQDIFTIDTLSSSHQKKWLDALKVILWGKIEYFKGKVADYNKTGDKNAKAFHDINEISPKSNSDSNNGEIKKRWTLKNTKADIRQYKRFYSSK